ncbi:MAG TPA: 4Fe-4S binding protein [Candidatus Mailhella merdigallinarum]|uniref:4Fe-4S binding protein n=1 Tax=Candidatus Mailhella merdigallinarum TaxID=2838658 RepID=A0A9D2HG53_9BACT|nr:4Fe-4S binding protein [Candidatus Mailhella merdigallinarum]
MPPVFDETKCIKCQKCLTSCPGYILEMGANAPRVAFPDECWHCGCCRVACGRGVISFEFPLHTLL